jgi:hypothetical protein
LSFHHCSCHSERSEEPAVRHHDHGPPWSITTARPRSRYHQPCFAVSYSREMLDPALDSGHAGGVVRTLRASNSSHSAGCSSKKCAHLSSRNPEPQLTHRSRVRMTPAALRIPPAISALFPPIPIRRRFLQSRRPLLRRLSRSFATTRHPGADSPRAARFLGLSGPT